MHMSLWLLDMGKIKAPIGSTDAPSKEYLVGDDDTTATGPSTDDDSSTDSDSDEEDGNLMDQTSDKSMKG
jgi:hypothetical protein